MLPPPAAQSFADMKKVNGEGCSSFRQECSRRGLLVDDADWRKVLRESFAFEFGPLSQVFAIILAYCEPSDPLSFWDEQKSLHVCDIRLRHKGRATAFGTRTLRFHMFFSRFKSHRSWWKPSPLKHSSSDSARRPPCSDSGGRGARN